jgi:hypothetical protein
MKNKTAMLVLAGAVVFASSIGAVAGCLSLSDGGGRGGGVGAGSTPSPSADAGLGTAAPTPEATASPDATREAPTETTRTTRPPQHDGPRIVSFRVKQQPQCPQGTSEYPVEGTPVTLEWKVTGVEKITISIDGPGVYATYPAVGSETFPFSCGGADPGETVAHTYKLKTVGGASTKWKQLTVTAEAYEITQV